MFKRIVIIVVALVSFSCNESPEATPIVQKSCIKVGVLGDSISTFLGEVCNDEYGCYYPTYDPNTQAGGDVSKAVDAKEKTWWWKLIYDYMWEAELDINSSWAGSTIIHKTMTGDKTGVVMWSGFIDRYADFNNPDIIFIHGGTNDLNKKSPLGEFDFNLAIENLDDTKFRSAYIKLIKSLKFFYADVKIVLIIGDALKNTDYGSSILTIADYFALPCVDFRDDNIPKCKGSHPNAQGFDFMAKKIAYVCKEYIPTIYTPQE